MLDIHSVFYILTSLTNDLSSDWPVFPIDESSLFTTFAAVWVCVCACVCVWASALGVTDLRRGLFAFNIEIVVLFYISIARVFSVINY